MQSERDQSGNHSNGTGRKKMRYLIGHQPPDNIDLWLDKEITERQTWISHAGCLLTNQREQPRHNNHVRLRTN